MEISAKYLPCPSVFSNIIRVSLGFPSMFYILHLDVSSTFFDILCIRFLGDFCVYNFFAIVYFDLTQAQPLIIFVNFADFYFLIIFRAMKFFRIYQILKNNCEYNSCENFLSQKVLPAKNICLRGKIILVSNEYSKITATGACLNISNKSKQRIRWFVFLLNCYVQLNRTPSNPFK